MRGIASSIGSMRMLLAMVLVAGVLSSQGGGGTLAYFTSSTTSSANQFSAGVVDIAGNFGGTNSTLPTGTFAWTTSYGGANCANTLTGTDITNQRMAPGHYCVAPVTINNNSANAINAWLRIRLFRYTASDSSVNDALNNKLRFYVSEYTSGGTTNAATAQTTDCTAANFKPNGSTSSATIGNSSTIGVDGVRTALTYLTTSGKIMGSGLGLATGPAATPTEANMATSGGSQNAVNIVGNDGITDPAGTNGTTAEATLNAGAQRYFCAAVFFPSDTDQTNSTNTTGDNAAQGGSNTYYMVVVAAQKAGR